MLVTMETTVVNGVTVSDEITVNPKNSDIRTMHEMSANNLMRWQGDSIEFVDNPKKPGSVFFACGSKVGYISKKVKDQMMTIAPEDLRYAEVSIKNGAFVPTLMIRAKNNVKRTITLR